MPAESLRAMAMYTRARMLFARAPISRYVQVATRASSAVRAWVKSEERRRTRNSQSALMMAW
jgi:hypothetical protein